MTRTLKSIRFLFIVAALTYDFSLIPAQGGSPHPGVLHFDLKWWNQANNDEQEGFIYGYQDCRQPVNAPTSSIDAEQALVSKA